MVLGTDCRIAFGVRSQECTSNRLHRYQSQRCRLARQVVDRRDETTDDVIHVEKPAQRFTTEQSSQFILQYGVALRERWQRFLLRRLGDWEADFGLDAGRRWRGHGGCRR